MPGAFCRLRIFPQISFFSLLDRIGIIKKTAINAINKEERNSMDGKTSSGDSIDSKYVIAANDAA